MAGFGEHQTIEELAAAQGVVPITDLSQLASVDATDEEIDAFMAALDLGRISCARCGATPPVGFASITVGDITRYLCHPDDETLPDCYQLS